MQTAIPSQVSSSDDSCQANRRVLVIDDNKSIHDDYNKILANRTDCRELNMLGNALFGDNESCESPADFDVESALQGEDGLSAVTDALSRNNPFAMAFVDMRMPPGWDGLETIKRLWEVDPYLQVVICSAYSDHTWQELVEALPKKGQWLLLRKPFDNVEVCQLALALTHKWDLERRSRNYVNELEIAVERRATELKQELERRLAAQESLLDRDSQIRAVFDTTDDAIVSMDSQAQVISANNASFALFGTSEQRLLGSVITDHLVDANGKRFCIPESNAEEKQVAAWFRKETECIALKEDGEQTPVSVAVSEFTCERQRMYSLILHDLRSRKEAESQLLQIKKLESIGQLAAGVAHELNTPLQYIADNTAFLADSFPTIITLLQEYRKLEEEASNHPSCVRIVQAIQELFEHSQIGYLIDETPPSLNDILDGTAKMQEIVGTMKSFTQPGAGKKVRCNIESIVRRCTASAVDKTSSCITCCVEIAPDIPSIYAYPGELGLAIHNVIMNAIEATTHNNTKGRITVRGRVFNGCFELLVEDGGSGMPQSIQEHVFDPFFTTKDVGSGLGQGLAVARSVIVDLHCGTIGFTTQPNEGTTFRACIPMA